MRKKEEYQKILRRVREQFTETEETIEDKTGGSRVQRKEIQEWHNVIKRRVIWNE